MSIVTISRESYSQGDEVAQKVAQRLGYECVSGDVLAEAAEEFHVPEIKLLRAVRDTPSVWDRFTFAKERYVAYFQAALLDHFQKDNVVYHGLAGHYAVSGVSHVLKVRYIGSREERVGMVMQREGVFQQAAAAMEGMVGRGVAHPTKQRQMTEEEALRVLDDSDEARRKWGVHLFGVDTHDASLYDLVIRGNKLSTDDAAEIIAYAARLQPFQATADSQQAVEDLALAARVKASLIDKFPRANVEANAGVVYVGLEGGSSSDRAAIQDAVQAIRDVKKIEVDVVPFATPD